MVEDSASQDGPDPHSALENGPYPNQIHIKILRRKNLEFYLSKDFAAASFFT
jgi:hypothetical protein